MIKVNLLNREVIIAHLQFSLRSLVSHLLLQARCQRSMLLHLKFSNNQLLRLVNYIF